MASIALRRVNGKMLYIAEVSEIPVGNKAYRSILMENNVTVKVRFAICIITQFFQWTIFFRRERSSHQLLHVLVQGCICGGDALKFNHKQVL